MYIYVYVDIFFWDRLFVIKLLIKICLLFLDYFVYLLLLYDFIRLKKILVYIEY